MDVSLTGLLKILLPRAPLILQTAILNTLSLSPNSAKQDAKTEVTVAVLRSLMREKTPMGKVQRNSLKDPGITGAMWVSKVTIPAPNDQGGPTEAILRAIKELGDGQETYSIPTVDPVECEWTGHRKGVDQKAARPQLSEEEHYAKLMDEVDSKLTILYFHGGAYVMMDPASHRVICANLARLTRGRCYSVRYRLAPQHPFPAQILDALIAYLSLIFPPPGSFHESVAASEIVFAGDSAGGNLSLALLQTILTLRRTGITTVRFHGQDVPIELPAGVAGNSPWCDIGRSLPSTHRNAHLDYLVPRSVEPTDPPADDVWPARPPRIDMYTDATTLMHPLVSPVAVQSELWKSAPPVYMCVGNETFEDEVRVVARRMYQAGVAVVFDGYEGQPHCFAMIFSQSPAGRQCYAAWSEFCTKAVAGEVQRRETGTWMKALSNPPTFDEFKLDEEGILSDGEVDRALVEARAKYLQKEQDLRAKWNEEPSKPKL